MTELRQEIYGYIDRLPERSLETLRQFFRAFTELVEANAERLVIEHDLSDDEMAIIDEGEKEYRTNPHSFITLDELKEKYHIGRGK